MKITVVICEYNPLHRGHIYHLSRAVKDLGAQKVVCIMSGNFTQRGLPAVADKYTRAVWAVKNGADLVVELPPNYVLTTAKYFALGGVKIASALQGDITLSFGSEIGDIEALKQVARFKENDTFKTLLDEGLNTGLGYAKSYSEAIAQVHPDYAAILNAPNNIMAVEYLKAIDTLGCNISSHTVARIGGGYSQTEAVDYPSASCIREHWQRDNLQAVSQWIPLDVLDCLKAISPDYVDNAYAKLFSLLKFNIGNISFEGIHGLKEGVENRISAAVRDSSTWQELLTRLATKRYTDAYLLRTLINILINNTSGVQDLQERKVDYVNVLAVKQDSKDLLSCFDCQVITKSSQLPKDSLINTCDALYSSVTKNMSNYMQIVTR